MNDQSDKNSNMLTMYGTSDLWATFKTKILHTQQKILMLCLLLPSIPDQLQKQPQSRPKHKN